MYESIYESMYETGERKQIYTSGFIKVSEHSIFPTKFNVRWGKKDNMVVRAPAMDQQRTGSHTLALSLTTKISEKSLLMQRRWEHPVNYAL